MRPPAGLTELKTKRHMESTPEYLAPSNEVTYRYVKPMIVISASRKHSLRLLSAQLAVLPRMGWDSLEGAKANNPH